MNARLRALSARVAVGMLPWKRLRASALRCCPMSPCSPRAELLSISGRSLTTRLMATSSAAAATRSAVFFSADSGCKDN